MEDSASQQWTKGWLIGCAVLFVALAALGSIFGAEHVAKQLTLLSAAFFFLLRRIVVLQNRNAKRRDCMEIVDRAGTSPEKRQIALLLLDKLYPASMFKEFLKVVSEWIVKRREK